MTNRSHHPAQPLIRDDMPRDFTISFERYSQGRSVRIPENKGPRQVMAGYEEQYANIVDYVVRITHHIWEDRAVDYIADTYAADSLVFDDYGLQHGNAKIIADTHHTTGAFPDIVLDAEEVIWAGDAVKGFSTSHRVRIAGTNDGPSNYGPPTGRRVEFLCLANCVSRANEIFLEHVCYNSAAQMIQLGLDPAEEAARLAQNPPPGWPRDAETWARLRREGAPETPLSVAEPVDGFDPDAFARQVIAGLWGDGGLGSLADTHDADLPFEGPTLRKGQGRDDYAEMYRQLRLPFTDRRPQVDEVFWMGNDAEGYLVSTRWSMDARHGGAGTYGAPTGAELQVWGITQHRVEGGRVREEWMLFNELDVMIQIARARAEEAA